MLRLVERADVVVENFTPRVLGNVGLEYEDLVARRPDVILLRMPAFGLDGPWRDRQRIRADHRAGVGHRVDDR